MADRGDPRLAQAARTALGRIGALLPPDRRAELMDSALFVGPKSDVPEGAMLQTIRTAMRAEHKLRLTYADATGAASERVVWPVVLAFMERVRILVGWCELRQGFRHFRTDRIATLEALDAPYPRRRRQLAREWREIEGVPER